MCQFANGSMLDVGKPHGRFIHPVVRAILLHFWLAYDHPFIDGNGRTARSLFYWSMLRQGYWLFEFVSISEILIKAPAKYSLSFLFTETDENDATYFLLYQCEVIRRAITSLHEYIEQKSTEVRESEGLLRGATGLNHRQQALIAHALRHPGTRYSIEGHRRSQGIVYETARNDLMVLARMNLLEHRKIGRAFAFIAPSDLADRLQHLSVRR
jgi:Fic family protein